MDDYHLEEMRVLVRAALDQHDEVEKAQTGPRHNEISVHLADGRLRVITMIVRDHI